MLDWSKFKAFADSKIILTQKLKFVLGRVENIVGKRKCWLAAFSSLPTIFSIAYFSRDVKKKMKFVFERVENIMGKKRKCWLKAFSPSPTMFSIAFFSRGVKSWVCVVLKS